MFRCLDTFGKLFNEYRLKAGFLSLGDFGKVLAEEGVVYEDSMFSKWKSGERVPRRRAVLLAVLRVLVRYGGVSSYDEANRLLGATGSVALSLQEIESVFRGTTSVGFVSRFSRVEHEILTSRDFAEVAGHVVNGLVYELGYYEKGYRIVVLTLVDEETGELRRVALSRTEEATKAVQACPVPFHKIVIPMKAKENILVDTVERQTVNATSVWPCMFAPTLTAMQAVANQRSAGIVSSMTYPLVVKGKSIGALIYSMVKDKAEVSSEEFSTLRNFSDTVAVGVFNAMRSENRLFL